MRTRGGFVEVPLWVPEVYDWARLEFCDLETRAARYCQEGDILTGEWYAADPTPGPWEWREGTLYAPGESTRIHAILNDDGCTVYRGVPVVEFQREVEANKRVIAAAPDLLTAARALVANWDAYWNRGEEYIDDFEQAEQIEELRRAIGLAERVK